MSSICIHIC